MEYGPVVGAILTGAAVVAAATLTIYFTGRRQRFDQLENRAAERARQLTEYYGDFFAAAYEAQRSFVRAEMNHQFISQVRPIMPDGQVNWPVAEEKQALQEALTMWKRRREAALEASEAAAGRLAIWEWNADRRAMIFQINLRLQDQELDHDVISRGAIGPLAPLVHKFEHEVRKGIQREYLEAVEYAKRGMPPPVVVPTPDPSPREGAPRRIAETPTASQ